jgi:serine/threonine protein kinase
MHFKTVAQFIPAAGPEALNLIQVFSAPFWNFSSVFMVKYIQACFQFNPERRPSSVDLLNHVYINEFHNEAEETIYPYGKQCVGENAVLHECAMVFI